MEVPEGLVVLKCIKHLPPNTSIKLEAVREQLAKEVFDKKLQMEIPQQFNELKKQANPKLFLKHAETEEELVREVRKELQSDPSKPGSPSRTTAHGN